MQRDATTYAVNRIFDNALRRARISWRVSLSMTLSIFILIMGMIVISVTLAVPTRQSQWALMFGGVSIPTVIGVTIWKPYDRLFHSVVLVQRLEMIHVQTMAAFSGTETLEKRIEICTNAVNELTMLLKDTNAIPPTRPKRSHNHRWNAARVKPDARPSSSQ